MIISTSSTAYVSCKVGGKTHTYRFTGVTGVEHTLSLNLENDSAQGTDIVNGARNLAGRVTLSVVETDTEHSPGWSARMLKSLAALKKGRTLCKVVTSMASYSRMLLTEINAVQDEENQDGWSGTLVFVEYIPEGGGKTDTAKTNSNSSVRRNTGAAGTKKIVSPILRILSRL